MKQLVHTEHVLEIKRGDGPWYRPMDSAFHLAERLMQNGRFNEAFVAARDEFTNTFGYNHGARCRIVTTTRTITVSEGEFE